MIVEADNFHPLPPTTTLLELESSSSPRPCTIKGYCKDCLFLIQEWHLQWKRHEGAIQEYMELDQYCQLHDNFVPDLGYCHGWESRD